jgi:DHA3 family tetracycline resistance protein-like MFS transporter
MLVATSSLTAIGMLGFGITRNFWWAAGFYSLSYALRIASSPIQMAWINQNIETKVRATILSMDNQVNYMGRMIGGPMIGAIGSTFTLPLALITTGVLRIPIALLFTRMWMRYHHDQDKINETYPARFP